MQSRRDEQRSSDSNHPHGLGLPRGTGQPFQSQYASMTTMGGPPNPHGFMNDQSMMNMGHMAATLPGQQHANIYMDTTQQASHMSAGHINMANQQYHQLPPQPYYPLPQQQYPGPQYAVYSEYPKSFMPPQQPPIMTGHPYYQMQHIVPPMQSQAATLYPVQHQGWQPQPSYFGHHNQQGYQGPPNLRSHSYGLKGSMDVITATFPHAESLSHLSHPQGTPKLGVGTSSGSTGATAGTMPNAQNASVVPRGPPRKPRQSGHALWVGNLPPHATVVDLKDHFSRGATNEILSLKLMSKSNCAFVNYKTSASCAMAMHRFHNSRFHGNRLVCRLRKTGAEDVTDPLDRRPSATLEDMEAQVSPSGIEDVELRVVGSSPDDKEVRDHEEPSDDEDVQAGMAPLVDGEQASDPSAQKPEPPLDSPDQYFVLKSLTLEDLIVSTQNRIWTTQSHNEVQLDAVYKKAKNVYLIFSVNKSGEYFGYARMASAITQLPDDALSGQTGHKTRQMPNQPEYSSYISDEHSGHTERSDAALPPKSTPTPKTATAPRGRIIDDLARGTIFWEIDTDDEVEGDGHITSPTSTGGEALPNTVSRTSSAASGNCFYLDWISTKRLPFYKTRGIRNALNGNRDVKIARDGTRLPPDVGARLLALINHGAVSPHDGQFSG